MSVSPLVLVDESTKLTIGEVATSTQERAIGGEKFFLSDESHAKSGLLSC